MKKIGKIFMVFCVLFSQFSGVLNVLAEGNEIVASIAVNINDDYSLTVKGTNVATADDYDIYVTTSYKYSYVKEDGSTDTFTDVINDKINTDSVSSDTLNSDSGYVSSIIDSIEKKYSAEVSVDVTVKSASDEGKTYTGSAKKDITGTTSINVKANGDIVDEEFTVPSGNLKVTYTTDTVDFGYSVYVNGELKTGDPIDYTDKLYGDYTYKYEVKKGDKIVAGNNIVVHYGDESNNDSRLTEDSANTDKYTFKNGNVYILGKSDNIGADTVINDIKSFDIFDNGKYNIDIKDNNGDPVIDGNISNGMKLVISMTGYELSYNIVIVGDTDNNGKFNEDDITNMVESILSEENYYEESADIDINKVINIFDVTKAINNLNNKFNKEVIEDEIIKPFMEADVSSDINVLDTFNVTFSLEGFKENFINGLSGKVNFDKNIFSLEKVTYNKNVEMKINEDGEFIIYSYDNYNSNESLFTLTFKTIGSSNSEYITIDNLVAAYAGEEVKLSSNTISLEFNVTYVNKEEVNNNTDTGNAAVMVNTDTNNKKYVSSDSYLSSLSIDGYEIEFSPYTYKYSITVSSDVDHLDLSAILSDSRSTYTVYGNENFKEGENIVTVVVTAEDGSTHTYTLLVNKEADKDKISTSDKEDVSSSSNVSRTIIVVLIILVIIGLIYIIFKDDEEERLENNKNKKENK